MFPCGFYCHIDVLFCMDYIKSILHQHPKHANTYLIKSDHFKDIPQDEPRLPLESKFSKNFTDLKF